MSRGPGVWQRQILRVTNRSAIATVSGIVRTAVISPDRNDHTAARRAAKQLALAERISATYIWGCTECCEPQDVEDPQRCCGPVRPLLAVMRPERRKLIRHPAPPPGSSCPSWVNVVPPPRPPGQLQAVDVDDLAALAVQRLWDRLEAGAAVSAHDVVALLKLAREVEHDAARQGAGNDARWQATLREVLWLARRHLGEGWKPFAADLRASEAMTLLWGPPPPRPGRPAPRL